MTLSRAQWIFIAAWVVVPIGLLLAVGWARGWGMLLIAGVAVVAVVVVEIIQRLLRRLHRR